MMTETPLFIPLKTEYFEAFKSGAKTIEYRKHGRAWTAANCRIGKAVTLSKGYGKHQRLKGVVVGFSIVGPDAHPAIRSVYPEGDEFAAIEIKLVD